MTSSRPARAPQRRPSAPLLRLVALGLGGALALGASCEDRAAPSGGGGSGPGGAPALPVCERLFGRPSPSSGLGPEQCEPRCASCGGGGEGGEGGYVAPDYGAEELAALRAAELVDPPEVPTSDPYASAVPAGGDESTELCVVAAEGSGRYRLETRSRAEVAGARVTHEGACGACSTLADLAVYIDTPDLTEPVRSCAARLLDRPIEEISACIEELGFTPACARVWAYNARHTGEVCREICLPLLDAPYHEPDGSLNACIACDEEKSGPVFKLAAGRTRRNSGLATALCRPCTDVVPLEHRYGL